MVQIGNEPMNNQLKVPVGQNYKTLFLQSGFYHKTELTSQLHNHCYSEMHIISGGGVCIFVDGKEYSISENSVFVIPKGLSHSWRHTDPSLRHCALQIDDNVDQFMINKIPRELSELFFKEIDKVALSNNHNQLTCYLSLLLVPFFPDENCLLTKITDYELVINDFFAYEYSRNVTLKDLAKELYLSEKQTERLVIKYTGKTFKKALVEKRMSMADYLSINTTLNMTEITEYVGYSSYSGFWKAYNNYKKICKNSET